MGLFRCCRIGWSLLGLILVVGVATVNTQFSVNLDISPSPAKSGDELLLNCTYSLTHANTEQLIFFDDQGITVCLFMIRQGGQRCTDQYKNLVSNLTYNSSVPGVASLVYRLQPCDEPNIRFRCTVTNIGAQEITGITGVDVKNVPEPNITCTEPCEIEGDTIQFSKNSTQRLVCSVSEATPRVNLTWSQPYANVNDSLTENTGKCTYDAMAIGEPRSMVNSETDVTCTVTAEDGTQSSRTVRVKSEVQTTEVPIQTSTLTPEGTTTENNNGNQLLSSLLLMVLASLFLVL